MENQIYIPGDPFLFDKLTLTCPRQGTGADVFVSDFQMHAQSRVGMNVFFQSPRCSLEKELVFTGRKQTCDLCFSQHDDGFNSWMSDLIEWVIDYMYTNRTVWFIESDDITKDYIEAHFTHPFKMLRGGRMKMRTNLNKNELMVYNEHGDAQPDVASLRENIDMVHIIWLRGVRCVGMNFMLDMDDMQIMLFAPLFNKCLIVGTSSSKNNIKLHTEESTELSPIKNTDTQSEPPPDPIKPQSEPSETIKEEEKLSMDPPTIPVFEEMVPVEEFSDAETLCDDDDSDTDSLLTDETVDYDSEEEKEQYFKEKEKLLPPGLEELILEVSDEPDPKDLYREARLRAKRARDEAMSLHLESKRVKNKYAIEDVSEDDDDF